MGTAEKQVYSGLQTELPESVAPGGSCCCRTNHTAGAVSLTFWAFPSPGSHGTVVCSELPWRCIVLEAAPHCLWEYLQQRLGCAGGGWDAGRVLEVSRSWLCESCMQGHAGGVCLLSHLQSWWDKPWLLHRAGREKLSKVSAL